MLVHLVRWSVIMTIVLVTTGAAGAQGRRGERVAHFTFDGDADEALGRWENAAATAHMTDQGALAVTASATSRNNMVRRRLPLDQVRGAMLGVSARVRAEDVAKPPEPWNGVKVMVHTVSPTSGPQWSNVSDLHGTFDWRTVSFAAPVPRDATEAWLVLGLQDTTGRALFDDVTVTIDRVERTRPATRPAPLPTERLDRRTDRPRLRGVMYGWRGNEDDLRTLARWNVNLIRWQLHWVENGVHDGWRDLDAYDRWLNEALDEVDRWLPLCEELNIKVLIDLHTPPGGGIMLGNWALFQDKHYQDRFIEMWDDIANRYKGNRTVWGYDLANEPIEGVVADGLMDWRTLAETVARRIRAIDADHVIVYEPGPGGGWENLAFCEPLDVPGVVYSPHMYVPGQFTHQGVFDDRAGVTYPGVIDGKHWDKEALRAALQPVRDYQLDHNVPVYVGEFSAIRWAPGDSAERYLRDCIEIFEEYGWDWTYHAFREWHGWSVEHGPDRTIITPSQAPTGREQLLRSYFERNER